jgi:hypothetical protein
MTRRSERVIPGPPLRGIFSFRDVDHIDRQIRQLGAEGCRKIIATQLDKAQFCMWKFPVHVFNGDKVHRSILANRRMRTAACLDAPYYAERSHYRS